MHDQGDAVDVDAPGGDVGGHQHVEAPLAELGQGTRTDPLVLATVQGAGPHPDLGQLLDQPVDGQLRPDEHDGPAARLAIAASTSNLSLRRDEQRVVLHRVDRGHRRVDLVGDRVGA